MENENREELTEETQVPEQPPVELVEEPAPYVPRPMWQRILAWIGVVVFVLVIIMYYINMMRGGI